ncbi:MAG TPA: HAD family phosphatase [Verrucomicrobiota bacterium]|nr:hypothetical protein [Verrucomicrobiales bacterium]HRI15978.1 HAD family phosphatase [Verrucomicrobiota bacterium]
MRPYSAVIFDLDGVIVNSEPLHEQSFLDVFAELGYRDNHGIHFPDYYGRSDRTVWLDFINRHRPPHELEPLTARKQARFLELLRASEPLFAGIPELVEQLAATARLAVASGSTHDVINAVLSLRNLRRHFPVTVSSTDVVHGKPAPDIFLRAAALLGVVPTQCIVIEDSAAGIAAAKAAGMRVIGITNSLSAAELHAADSIVSDYAQIEKLLLSS